MPPFIKLGLNLEYCVGGHANNKTKAIVAWDTTIVANVKGGIKFFDPQA
jgi:hypothetical protein